MHWPRHIPSLRAYGVTTDGIWTDHDAGANRLVALIAYPDGAEPGEVTAAYLASPRFAADMQGFTKSSPGPPRSRCCRRTPPLQRAEGPPGRTSCRGPRCSLNSSAACRS
ncbi:hypothetical protein [Kribbella orskensis]|uniref:hypothetical protein n=1 Tax=Kribbella TaxID=182639 RepID=UPI0034E24ABA